MIASVLHSLTTLCPQNGVCAEISTQVFGLEVGQIRYIEATANTGILPHSASLRVGMTTKKTKAGTIASVTCYESALA